MPSRITLILLLFLLGCANPQTVSRVQLEQLKDQWNEPKYTMWYYVGSKNGFHYFHHDDIGDDKKDFKISEDELIWQDTFPLTRLRKKWRQLCAMPLGSRPRLNNGGRAQAAQ